MAVIQDWSWKPPFASTFTSLQTLAFNIASFGGRTRMAARVGQNIGVQYRDGTLWTPKDYDENQMELAMWMIGADPVTGAIPSDPSDKFWDNVDILRRLFRTDVALGELKYTHPVTGETVIALAEVADAVDFATMAGATRAAFFVTFTIPGIWFRDVLYKGETVYTSRAHDAVWDVTVDSDVIMKDPLIWIRSQGAGGQANIRLINQTWGNVDHWMQYSAVLGAGEEIEIDVAKWRATLNGTSRVTGNVEWSGQPQFFWLLPGVNSLKLEVGSGPVDIKVQAKGAYW